MMIEISTIRNSDDPRQVIYSTILLLLQILLPTTMTPGGHADEQTGVNTGTTAAAAVTTATITSSCIRKKYSKQ